MQDLRETIEFDLKICLEESEDAHFHQEIELLYVMEGQLRLNLEEKTYLMKEEDIVTVNSNKSHSVRSEPNCLYARIHIPYKLLSDATNSRMVLLWCNSVAETSANYRDLRTVLRNLINEAVNGRKDRYFYRYSLCYQLLHYLANYYMVTREDVLAGEEKRKSEDRLADMMEYIHSNYYRSISLQDLADHLFLTKTYLSKYFKKKLGMNFLEYLNNIRIHHAMDDLLHTDHAIVRVAMDNGFPNVSTFNRLFKEYYKESPSSFRQQKIEKKETEKQPDMREEELKERLEKHFKTGRADAEEESFSDVVQIQMDYWEGEPYRPCWNQIINIGAADELLASEMREHLILAKKLLGIRYARIWNIFSEKLFLAEDIAHGHLNFEKLNQVLRFLKAQDIIPFIELGEKPFRIQKSVSEYIVAPDNKTIFSTYEDWKRTLEVLMRHLIAHFGEGQVSLWKFELWDDRREETWYARPAYSIRFKEARDIIKKYAPKAQLGGAGRHLGWFRRHTTEGIRQWVDSGIYPDFLTYYYFPYSVGEIDREVYSRRKMDEDDLKHVLEELKEELLRLGFPSREIYVTDWNGTVSDRDYINDSAWKGAWVVKNYLDALGKVDAMAFNGLSDLPAQYYDTQGPLNGSRGAISKDGIMKPAMHAMGLMALLKPWRLGQGENYLLTTDRAQRIVIVCHNFKKRNYLYFVKAEGDAQPEEQYQYFDNQDSLRVKLKLKNMADGTYLQKAYTVNREHGSVLDEWSKMDYIRHLRNDDLEYLKQICIPEITLNRFEVSGGVIEREWYMQPHEIKVVEFICLVRIDNRDF